MTLRRLSHDEIPRVSAHAVDGLARHPLVLVVDNVRSLYNVGSIFRSCDGALVEKLYLCGYTPHPPRKEIEKTALGADRSVPWEYHRDCAAVLRGLRAEGWTVAALEHTDGSVPLHELRSSAFPLAVVVGNELAGVSDDALEACDLALEIPMYGMKQSLNVAVAAGILCFHAVQVWRTGQAHEGA